MSTSRLQQQFIRLWQRCHGETTDTTLQALAEVLSCSRRHVRSLLSAMQREGWLTWQAESGRGKRSRLTFHYTGLALQQQRAEELLEQDRIDQLVQLVGDKTWCARCCCRSWGAASARETHSAGALLPAAVQPAARLGAAAFGDPFGAPDLQRPDAHK